MTDQKTPVREPWKKEENATRPPLPPFSRETAIQKISRGRSRLEFNQDAALDC